MPLAAVGGTMAASGAHVASGIPIVHALVLGVTQGLSEFLPISSSGHLLLVPWFLGWKDLTGANAELNRTFDVALHIGTLVGAVAYFRHDLVRLGRAAWASFRRRSIDGDDERLAWLLVVSALPGATAGALLDALAGDALSSVGLVAVLLIGFGGVLLVADRAGGDRGVGEFARRDAMVMGVCQALALFPGVSRSGVTISAGRWMGLSREAAARTSFLMGLPLIAGAGLYKGAKVLGDPLPPGTGAAFAAGMAASAVTGCAAVWLVLRLVRTRSFAPFVVERVAVGLAALAALATGLR